MAWVAILLLPILLFCNIAQAQPYCLNQAGAPVSWWFIRKVPGGPNYLYADPSTAGLVLFPGEPSYLNSSFGRTVDQADPANNQSIYVFYNDQPAFGNVDLFGNAPSEEYAVGKGLLMFNRLNGRGFHLVHSLPKFPRYTTSPPSPTWNRPSSFVGSWYPENTLKMGQSLYCYNVSSVDNLSKVLKMNNYYFVKSNLNPAANLSAQIISSFPNFASMLTNYELPGSDANLRVKNCVNLTTCTPASINMGSGEFPVSIYAKSTMLKTNGVGFDTLSQVVLPSFPVNRQMLLSQSWAYLGSAEPLFSFGCTYDAPTRSPVFGPSTPKVWDVRYTVAEAQFPQLMSTQFPPGFSQWSTAYDHAKLAFPINPIIGTYNMICVGDTDRTVPHRQRGGGAVCFSNFNISVQLNKMSEQFDCGGYDFSLLQRYTASNLGVGFVPPAAGPLRGFLPPSPGTALTPAPQSMGVQIRDNSYYLVNPLKSDRYAVAPGGGYVGNVFALGDIFNNIATGTITTPITGRPTLGMDVRLTTDHVYICDQLNTAVCNNADVVASFPTTPNGSYWQISQQDSGDSLALLTTMYQIQNAVSQWHPSLVNLTFQVFRNASGYSYQASTSSPNGRGQIFSALYVDVCPDQLYRQVAWYVMDVMSHGQVTPVIINHQMDTTNPPLTQAQAFYNGFANALMMILKDSMGVYPPYIINECALDSSNPRNVPNRDLEHFNSSPPYPAWGPETEGRVTAAIWDLYDSNNDNPGGNPAFGAPGHADNNEGYEVSIEQLLTAFAVAGSNGTIYNLYYQLLFALSADAIAFAEDIMYYNYLPLASDMCYSCGCSSFNQNYPQDTLQYAMKQAGICPSVIQATVWNLIELDLEVFWLGGANWVANRGIYTLISHPNAIVSQGLNPALLFLQAYSFGTSLLDGYCTCSTSTTTWGVSDPDIVPMATQLLWTAYLDAPSQYYKNFGALEIVYLPRPRALNSGLGDGLIISVFSGQLCNFFVGTAAQFSGLGPTANVCPTGPQIYSISPSSGPAAGGTAVTITGIQFNQTSFSILFGDQPCVGPVITGNTMTCNTPANIGRVKVSTSFAGKQFSTFELPTFQFNGPQFYNTVPSGGPALGNTNITIIGKNFGTTSSPAVTSIKIGSSLCTNFYVVNDAQIRCTTPAGVGISPIVYSTSQISNKPASIYFTYNIPQLTQLQYANASTSGGQPLTIVGKNFGSNRDVVIVSFGDDLEYARIMGISDGQLRVEIPPGAGSRNITVIVAGQASAPFGTFIYDSPSISDIQTAGITTGGHSTVIISGSNFGPQNSDFLTVMLNGVKILAGFVAPGSDELYNGVDGVDNMAYPSVIFAYIAPGIGGGNNLTIEVGGRSVSREITFAPPVLYNLVNVGPQPTQGGGHLIINGSNFVPTGFNSGGIALSNVTIGGVLCLNITWVSDERIDCEVPPGIGTETVIVNVGGQAATNQLDYTYDGPTVNSTYVMDCGDTLMIYGTNFVPAGAGISPGNYSTIFVNGEPCLSHYWFSATECKCGLTPHPSGLFYGNLTVMVAIDGQDSNNFSYPVPHPIVHEVSPQSGPGIGGTFLNIFGDRFEYVNNSVECSFKSPSVHLEGIEGYWCVNVEVHNDTYITCNTSAGAGANLSVNVNIAGQNSMPYFGFSYDAPQIYYISPDVGPTAGHINMSIHGVNFGPEWTLVYITWDGEEPIEAYSVSDSLIEFELPPGQGKNISIKLDVAGQFATTQAYSYQVPTATSIEPNVGPIEGGTLVTIYGDNLGVHARANVSVTIGGLPCTNATLFNETQITCETPAGSGANVSVVITVAGQEGPAANIWSYYAPQITMAYPSIGYPGITVTIIGENFASAPNHSSILVGGVTCETWEYFDTTMVTAVIPYGAGKHHILVNISGQLSNPWNFTYLTPTVTSIDPTVCTTTRGCSFSVDGTNFNTTLGGTTITIDGRQCTDVHGLTSKLATGNTIAYAGANLSVAVTVNGFQSPPNNVTFSFSPPTITDMHPGEGFGAAQLVVMGTNFGPKPWDISGSYISYNNTIVSSSVNIYHWNDISIVFFYGTKSAEGVDFTVYAHNQPSNAYLFTLPFDYSFTIGNLFDVTALVQGDHTKIKEEDINQYMSVKLSETSKVSAHITKIQDQFELRMSVGLAKSADADLLSSEIEDAVRALFSEPQNFSLQTFEIAHIPL